MSLVLCGKRIKTVLAPMAGYTDIAFRELCAEEGADLTVTEMVSTRGLVHGNEATGELMRLSQKEAPSCIQLFGSDPDDFARSAELICCDVIDINMGCPMPKIIKNGDGAALLRKPELAGKIVKALKNATDRPITVKTRLGYARSDGTGAAELVQAVAEAGAATVAVHGRYAEQRYSGEADIAAVKRIAAGAPLPIIANGDIDSAEVDGFVAVMIGRHALENPTIFRGERCDPFDVATRHISLLQKYFDDRYTVLQCRKFFVHYFKGMRGSKALRDEVNRADTPAQVRSALDKARRAVYNNEQ